MARRVLIKSARAAFASTIVQGEASGSAIIRELGEHPFGYGAFAVYRLVCLWAEQPRDLRAAVLDRKAVREILVNVASGGPFAIDDPRAPFVYILGEITCDDPDLRRTATACIAVADWALAIKAVETALAYAGAAALVGANSRFAWIAGRLHREHSRIRSAEVWLQAAYAQAAREHDRDARALSLLSWGHLHLNVGRYERARDLFERGLNIAIRAKLNERAGEAHHYLFTTGRALADHTAAMRHGLAAANHYAPDHPRLRYFAHDLACYWLDRGDCVHALHVLMALLDGALFDAPSERLLVLGSAIRAAGDCQDEAAFEELVNRFQRLEPTAGDSPLVAQSLYAAARGAAAIGGDVIAEAILKRAILSAVQTNQSDTRIAAELLLDRLQDPRTRPRSSRAVDPANEELAKLTVRSLRPSSAG